MTTERDTHSVTQKYSKSDTVRYSKTRDVCEDVKVALFVLSSLFPRPSTLALPIVKPWQLNGSHMAIKRKGNQWARTALTYLESKT